MADTPMWCAIHERMEVAERGHRPWDQAQYAYEVNAVLHKLLGVWTPCETACTHRLVGSLTALGAANVLARHTADSGRRGA